MNAALGNFQTHARLPPQEQLYMFSRTQEEFLSRNLSGQHDGIIQDLDTYGSDEDSIDNDINLFLYFFFL